MSQKLSLQNALLTLEQLQQTPSRKDGITEEQEDNMRQLGCHFIQTAGILLKLYVFDTTHAPRSLADKERDFVRWQGKRLKNTD